MMQSPEQQKKQEETNRRLKENLGKITKKLFILSNKGGVGKSFVATSLALVAADEGLKTGVLDADVHGPSVAHLLGVWKTPLSVSEKNIIEPIRVNDNLTAVSTASLLKSQDDSIIWRGPLKMGLLKQFLADVNWGELDLLVVDSPPGTGDEPLSIAQLIPDISAAIVVTTPQDIALLDSRKCVSFLNQLKVPTLGILENMSGMECPHCGKPIDIFKQGGGKKAAKELGIPFLGSIPIDPEIVKASDEGKPYVLERSKGQVRKIIEKIVDEVTKL
ncbi:P-loop NTPase [candidate division WOR-3 bacterium]|uniref:Iron-sulfur cluster carrier protein n=1 Tax=candidate division WOR-3 bacterium TaxID=2052148 RepID=A0A9D5QC03_UNCW3|nr:P-loop NTPase [candidate division WOR-3 bacterium]MBD3364153.1 P-loop NTPase [candidate division WOR-3 bacterium]